MTESAPNNLFGKPDMKWVGVSYCLFVVYHMLPTMMMTMFARGGLGLGWNVGTLMWMFFGLALIGMYVGYKSRGVTILEPAISSVAYVATLMYSVRSIWELPYSVSSIWAGGAVALSVFAIVLVSAWVGELLQARGKAGRQAA